MIPVAILLRIWRPFLSAGRLRRRRRRRLEANSGQPEPEPESNPELELELELELDREQSLSRQEQWNCEKPLDDWQARKPGGPSGVIITSPARRFASVSSPESRVLGFGSRLLD